MMKRRPLLAAALSLALAPAAWRWRGSPVIDGWDPAGNRVQFKVPV